MYMAHPNASFEMVQSFNFVVWMCIYAMLEGINLGNFGLASILNQNDKKWHRFSPFNPSTTDQHKRQEDDLFPHNLKCIEAFQLFMRDIFPIQNAFYL